ncbi:DUF2989 domain-containing protein [Vibrio agarivorans]|uniref:DUF2989 domain-containing protein n=1 Tax=Vibrio agarivorans TaxID=153622 RepID=A0ABT7Y0I9_9VIBR|nr:DUF2989 domain-containing protein [Vibrio agarivorans]MDN2481490.1 DUF2989 domain-containing protein [Vibrio agarivorans]
MMNQLAKIGAMIAALTLLNGCFDNTTDTDRLCRDNPALQCEYLNMDDGQCRIPRTDLVWHKYEVLKHPTDVNKIKEIELVSAYRGCLELSAQIEPIDGRDRKTHRVETMIYMGEEQARLTENLKSRNSAEVLYFLWSKTGDESARRQFLQREGNPELDTASMQYALATFYSSRNEQKTEQLLHRSLELTGSNAPNVEIFKTLSSLYYRNEKTEQAYLWSMIAKAHGVPIASDEELSYLYRDLDSAQKTELNKQVDVILQEVELGSYQSRSIKL